MAKSYEILKNDISAITNEVEDGANTANRVGGAMNDIVDYTKESLEAQEERINEETDIKIGGMVVQETGDGEGVVMSQKAVSGKLAELASEVGAFNTTYQGGYLNVNGEYVGDGSYHSFTTEILPANEGDVFLYKGIGRSGAYSYIFRQGNNIIERGQVYSPLSFAEVITPSGVDSVQFSSFDAINNRVILEVVKKGYIGENAIKINNIINELKSVNEDIESRALINSNNLVNVDDEEYLSGYFISANGVLAESQTYDTSAFIKVVSGEKYNSAYEDTIGFRFVLFYDENKQFIYNTAIQYVDSFVAIENCSFVRVVFFANSAFKQLTQSDMRLFYQPYNPISKYIDSSVLGNNIMVQKTLNLLNPKDVTKGYYFNPAQGDIVASENYNVSGYIPVKGNTPYYAAPETLGFRFIVYYTVEKVKIGGDSNLMFFTTPSEAAFVRVTTYKVDEDRSQLTEGSAMPYEPYISLSVVQGTSSDKNSIATRQFVENSSGNILYGKKWAVCGDSFTDGATDSIIGNGKYYYKKKVYPYLIGNRNNMEILKFFQGGRTLAYPISGGFENSLTAPSQEFYYQNIPADIDYITIYLGINDSHHNYGSSGTDGEDITGHIPLGTIEDNTTASYYGAWNTVLSWLIENRPFAHIGIIVSNGCDSDSYRIAQIEIAKKYGIPYIDLNGDERTPAMIRSTNPNISQLVKESRLKSQSVSDTNLHPNDYAHEFESIFIESFLRTL